MTTLLALDPRNPAPAPGQARPPLLGALTSVRFFAAFHVLLYHFLPPWRDRGPFAWLIGSGYTGVSFFFTLSGFILVYSHAAEYLAGRGSPPRFYFARFARVYPIYLGALLITLLLEWHELLRPVHLLALAADLLLIQSWSTKTAIFFLAPAWTLSCEAFFYLAFPWLILHLRPRSNGSAIGALAVLWILATAAPLWYLQHLFGFQTHLWIQEHDSDLLNRIQFTPVFHLPQFLAGMVVGWIAVERPPHLRTARLLIVASLFTLTATLAGSQHLPYILLHNGLLLPGYAALILASPNPTRSRTYSPTAP